MHPEALFALLLFVFLGLIVLIVKPLGAYIADVMEGRPNFALRLGARFEGMLYRLCGVDAGEEMSWGRYALALVLFNVLGAVFVYALQRLQAYLPLNPQKFAAGPRTSPSTRP